MNVSFLQWEITFFVTFSILYWPYVLIDNTFLNWINDRGVCTSFCASVCPFGEIIFFSFPYPTFLPFFFLSSLLFCPPFLPPLTYFWKRGRTDNKRLLLIILIAWIIMTIVVNVCLFFTYQDLRNHSAYFHIYFNMIEMSTLLTDTSK